MYSLAVVAAGNAINSSSTPFGLTLSNPRWTVQQGNIRKSGVKLISFFTFPGALVKNSPPTSRGTETNANYPWPLFDLLLLLLKN